MVVNGANVHGPMGMIRGRTHGLAQDMIVVGERDSRTHAATTDASADQGDDSGAAADKAAAQRMVPS